MPRAPACVCVCVRARARAERGASDGHESAVRARARVRIQVEVFRNALEALYGGSCELLRFANRMISFFFRRWEYAGSVYNGRGDG